jgi:hypothetical protein
MPITSSGWEAPLLEGVKQLNRNIEELDKSSTALINTTNRLTKRIYWLTVGAFLFAGIQAVVGLITFFYSK